MKVEIKICKNIVINFVSIVSDNVSKNQNAFNEFEHNSLLSPTPNVLNTRFWGRVW